MILVFLIDTEWLKNIISKVGLKISFKNETKSDQTVA